MAVPSPLMHSMNPVMHRLDRLRPPSPSERQLLVDLWAGQTSASTGRVLFGDTENDEPKFLVRGWAAQQRLMPNGRRQIVRLFVPGEILGQPLSGFGSTTIVALTSLLVVSAGPARTAALSGRAPTLAKAFIFAAQENDRLLVDAVTRLGSMTARERMADLLIDLGERLALSGLGDGARFPMPLNQIMLSDVLGLSIVHTNRVLQQLRRDGLMNLASGMAHLPKLDALSAIAQRPFLDPPPGMPMRPGAEFQLRSSAGIRPHQPAEAAPSPFRSAAPAISPETHRSTPGARSNNLERPYTPPA